MSYGSPLESDQDQVSPLVTSDDAANLGELQRSRRSIHGQYFSKTEICLQNILTLLNAILMIILVGCPYQVKVNGADKSKGPYQNHGHAFGTYTIQNGEIHGRDWYKKGDNVISYCGTNWYVTDMASLGKCEGWFDTSDDDLCPDRPGYTWRYYVQSVDDWFAADRHMKVFSAS